jgi:hypothetical protein
MKKTASFATLLAVLIIVLHACSKDEKAVAPPVPGNEFITTVQLKVTNAADTTDVQLASWKDLTPDDPDGIDSSKAVLTLKANTTYNVQVLFLDETKTPVGDVTAEIKERQNYHLICFSQSSRLLMTEKRTDKDNNTPALEVGLEDQFTTGAASSGILNVQLRHQPNVKNGSCDPGSTDADVDYAVTIQ